MKKNLRKTILFVEDDELFRDAINNFLTENYTVRIAVSAEIALRMLDESQPDLILLDFTLPGMCGIELLKIVKKTWPDLPVIMLTALDRIAKVVEAIKLGAYDYLVKPIDAEEVLLTIARALEAAEVRRELEQRRNLQLLKNIEYKIVGNSAAINQLKQEIARAGHTDATILLEGQTGTGKELVARALHASSPRASGPFVPLNCGAFPRELMESELFGHRKGAFTSAQKDQIGKFQLAHHGTLLLDEIGELSPEAQIKVLRAVEEQEFYPVGATDLVHVDVRIIASTNKNLKQLVEQKLFREDLFFRLNVYPITLPELRERNDDVLLLAKHFMDYFNQKFGKNFQTLSPEAQAVLLQYTWPGNVRELRNLIERIVLAEEGTEIKKAHLRFLLASAPAPEAENALRLSESGLDLEAIEQSLLRQALELAHGNKTQAAKLLRLTPPTFYYRLKKYGLEGKTS
ncbi:MAG: Regulatory protein AtoC [bacterium]|nr:Regulatory protein AtoC [bacterium]